ncbi:hypothetical protein QVD17_11556 [Tagetes erecta]|uniref:Uncharacterized protein n=1 Tax=Tagetes erecta TaxID=13708 RepID=A0AAD8P106_TARER|nr:hypothetical protein QVD17_11556 [Tagetes erecta]
MVLSSSRSPSRLVSPEFEAWFAAAVTHYRWQVDCFTSTLNGTAPPYPEPPLPPPWVEPKPFAPKPFLHQIHSSVPKKRNHQKTTSRTTPKRPSTAPLTPKTPPKPTHKQAQKPPSNNTHRHYKSNTKTCAPTENHTRNSPHNNRVSPLHKEPNANTAPNALGRTEWRPPWRHDLSADFVIRIHRNRSRFFALSQLASLLLCFDLIPLANDSLIIVDVASVETNIVCSSVLAKLHVIDVYENNGPKGVDTVCVCGSPDASREGLGKDRFKGNFGFESGYTKPYVFLKLLHRSGLPVHVIQLITNGGQLRTVTLLLIEVQKHKIQMRIRRLGCHVEYLLSC